MDIDWLCYFLFVIMVITIICNNLVNIVRKIPKQNQTITEVLKLKKVYTSNTNDINYNQILCPTLARKNFCNFTCSGNDGRSKTFPRGWPWLSCTIRVTTRVTPFHKICTTFQNDGCLWPTNTLNELFHALHTLSNVCNV